MKKINLFIIGIIAFLCGNTIVDAGSFSLNLSDTSVNVGKEYKVEVKYSGDTLGSAKFNLTYSNATCTGSSSISSVLGNCSGSKCAITLQYSSSGYTSGSTLYTLSCKSTSVGTSKFNVALDNGDAWSVDGTEEVKVNSDSASVKIVSPTTTTTTTTTTTSTTKKITTANKDKITTTKKTTTQTDKNKTTSTTTKKASTTTTTKKIKEETTSTNPILDSTSSTTTTTKAINSIAEEVKLSTLKIVGYPIDFKQNRTSYDIRVSENVNEIYIIADPVNQETKIDNIGIVNIYNKSEIIIKVYNEETKNEIKYKIYIEREKSNDSLIGFIINNSKLIILFGSLAIFVAVIMLTIIKRTYSKTTRLEKIDNVNIIHEKIDIPKTEDDLKKVFSDINKEE